MSDEERDWTEAERLAVAGLEPVAFLVGSWVGAGAAHGKPLRGRMVGRRTLSGTWLDVREQLLDETGAVDHEDCHFYRFDVAEKQIKVLHLMAPAELVDRRVVLPEPSDAAEPGLVAFRWIAGPFAPRVDYRWDGEHLDIAVTMAFESEPASVMRYQRVDDPV